MAIITGIFLILTGILNLFVGLLALFPGLFEASLSPSQFNNSQSDLFISMLTTSYGLYAICHLAGSVVQICGGSYIRVISGKGNPLIHALAVLAVLSLGLEIYGWLFKDYLTFFATPGIITGVLCFYLYFTDIQ